MDLILAEALLSCCSTRSAAPAPGRDRGVREATRSAGSGGCRRTSNPLRERTAERGVLTHERRRRLAEGGAAAKAVDDTSKGIPAAVLASTTAAIVATTTVSTS